MAADLQEPDGHFHGEERMTFDIGDKAVVPALGVGVIKEIEKRQTAVGRERDKLDDLISELEQLRDNCQTAWDDLQHARDALSELV